MAQSIQLGQTADTGAASAGRRRHRHAIQATDPSSFQQLLLRAFQSQVATGRFLGSHGQQAAMRVPSGNVSGAAPAFPGTTPTTQAVAAKALDQAMAQEHIPASWRPALTFIMSHESGGQVDAKSPIHSARGLFQLTAANYHYNPHGAGSFGNAVEEAQGGIRYIRARYGTADQAMAFWNQNHWY